MADPILAFRTVTSCFLQRLELVNGVLTPFPVALPCNPEMAEVNPGISLEDIKHTGELGEDIVILSYAREAIPELSMDFGLATPDIEAMVCGRQAKVVSNSENWVRFEFAVTKANFAARSAGQYGANVTAQDPATTKAQAYRINAITKLAAPLQIVESNPVGDQIVIGDGLAVTFSPELVAQEANVYGWVPVVTAQATEVSSTPVNLFSAFIVGICFDNTIRVFTARRCSNRPESSLAKEPKRSIKFRILADAASGTGMGYSIRYLRETVVTQ